MADQETGVRRIDRNQASILVAGRMKSLAGAASALVVFVADYSRCVAEACSDRANDLAFPVANVILPEHGVFVASIPRVQSTRQKRLVLKGNLRNSFVTPFQFLADFSCFSVD